MLTKVVAWIALVVSLVAAGLGGFALYRSLHPAAPAAANTAATTPPTGNATGSGANNAANAPSNATVKTGTLTYENPLYGYTAVLPRGWDAAETKIFDDPTCPEPQNITVFTDAGKTLTLTVGFRPTSASTSIQCRTGLPAGQAATGPSVDVAGTKVPSTMLVDAFGGTPLHVFVGHTSTSAGVVNTKPFSLGGFELVIAIEQVDPVANPKAFEPSYTDITSLSEYQAALDLLASIKLPSGT